MKKALLLTYDYELFLGGRSGRAADCLIGPTADTMDLLNKYRVKGIFFVDTTCLLRLRESKNQAAIEDLKIITEQVQRMAAEGHEVFPHIHPHWLDAVQRTDGEWDLSDPTRYRFHRCGRADREELFGRSINVLKEIIHPVLPGYRPDCFRAGGWCIQPFGDFNGLFETYGIRFDMTVLSGFYSFTDAQYFDFTAAPDKPIYLFSDDVCTESPGGPYVEFTISSLTPGPARRLADRIWQKAAARLYRDQAYLRGSGYLSKNLDRKPVPARKGHDILNSPRERIAIELMSPLRLPLYKKFIRTHDYMHFISHPKMITTQHHRSFREFLEYATSRFELETDFRMVAHSSVPGL